MLTWNMHFDVVVDLARPELARLLARAQALADVIREIPLPPRAQERLHRLNILRAVRGTTGIEGGELTTAEIDRIADAPAGSAVVADSRQSEAQEARNAYDVMLHIGELLRGDPTMPISEELILDFHRRMMANLDAHGAAAGKYRVTEVRVGDYVPPSAKEAPGLVRRMVAWLNDPARRDLDTVVKAVLAHYFLVSIHPFADGNGRTARAIESFYLYQRGPNGGGINTRGFYSLANYLYRQRPRYFELLNQVRRDPRDDATPLVAFAAQGLTEELDAICKEILHHVRVIAFRDYARGHLSRNPNLRPANRQRLLTFVLSLLDLQLHGHEQGVPLHQLREMEGLLATLYTEKSATTLNRDLRFLRDEKLVQVEDGFVRANLALMSEFTL